MSLGHLRFPVTQIFVQNHIDCNHALLSTQALKLVPSSEVLSVGLLGLGKSDSTLWCGQLLSLP